MSANLKLMKQKNCLLLWIWFGLAAKSAAGQGYFRCSLYETYCMWENRDKSLGWKHFFCKFVFYPVFFPKCYYIYFNIFLFTIHIFNLGSLAVTFFVPESIRLHLVLLIILVCWLNMLQMICQKGLCQPRSFYDLVPIILFSWKLSVQMSWGEFDVLLKSSWVFVRSCLHNIFFKNVNTPLSIDIGMFSALSK